jgi:hypothetical protein
VVEPYPSEKYEKFVTWDDDIPNCFWKAVKLYKIPWVQSPPTRIVYIYIYIYPIKSHESSPFLFQSPPTSHDFFSITRGLITIKSPLISLLIGSNHQPAWLVPHRIPLRDAQNQLDVFTPEASGRPKQAGVVGLGVAIGKNLGKHYRKIGISWDLWLIYDSYISWCLFKIQFHYGFCW